MNNIVNQVYWDRVSDTYTNGSSIKKDSQNIVTFKNSLMPSGKTIIKWTSMNNYQSKKEVPNLPILLGGHDYTLKIDAQFFPEETAIVGIHFFDLQGIEFDKCIFTSLEQSFTYPERAVKYEIEIINGGCDSIIFRKLQIASDELDSNVFEDFLTYPVYKGNSEKDLGLILVDDSKRARQIAPFKVISDIKENLTFIYFAWQNKQQRFRNLEEYLHKNKDKRITIFSTTNDWDEILLRFKSILSNCKIVYSKQFLPKAAFSNGKWIAKNYQNIDQVEVVKAAINYYKG